MHILFTRFPLESARGGAERQALAVLLGLQAAGHEVHVLADCSALLGLCQESGIPTTPLRIGPPPVTKMGAVSFLWRQVGMRRRLIEAVTQLQSQRGAFDAVVMLSLTEKILLSDWCLMQGTRVLWWEHDRVGTWLRLNPWLPRLRSLATRVTTLVVSDLSRRVYVALGWPSARVIAIPNGVDPHRFADVPAPAAVPGTLRVGCVARLSAEKGVDVLIDAVAALPGAQLEIVGTGPEEGLLRKLLAAHAEREHQTVPRLSIRSSVPDLGAFYRSLDVFVLPSRDHDPFGLVAAEAMQLGIATVVTDQCGIAGYVQPGTHALVVPAESTSGLIEALRTLADPVVRQRVAIQGQARALRTFTQAEMVRHYLEVFVGAAA